MNPSDELPPIDAHLKAALRHAPDAGTGPPAAVSEHILRQARQASADPAATAGRFESRPKSKGVATTLIERWRTWWEGWGRGPMSGALAGMLVASFVGVMWWGTPPEDIYRPTSPSDAPSVSAPTPVAVPAPAPAPVLSAPALPVPQAPVAASSSAASSAVAEPSPSPAGAESYRIGASSPQVGGESRSRADRRSEKERQKQQQFANQQIAETQKARTLERHAEVPVAAARPAAPPVAMPGMAEPASSADSAAPSARLPGLASPPTAEAASSMDAPATSPAQASSARALPMPKSSPVPASPPSASAAEIQSPGEALRALVDNFQKTPESWKWRIGLAKSRQVSPAFVQFMDRAQRFTADRWFSVDSLPDSAQGTVWSVIGAQTHRFILASDRLYWQTTDGATWAMEIEAEQSQAWANELTTLP